MALGALTVSQVLVACLQVLLPGLQVPLAGPTGGGHVVDDARSSAAASSWIAIAPKLVCGELESLAEHRAATGIKSAAIVPIESICDGFPAPDTQQSICGFLKSAAARGGAQFVLLVGDAGVLPPGRMRIGSTTRCITDSIYADDDGDSIPERAVGRFPSADAPLVRQYADRIVAYERDSKPAGWRRRISFLAAQGGFGAVIDSALDSAVSGLLDRELPAAFDLRVLRPDANPHSGVPRKSEKNALRDLWESGSLVFLYAGHGSRNGMHTADAGPFTRTIFTTSDARQLSIRGGAPFVMMFACNYDGVPRSQESGGSQGALRARSPACRPALARRSS